VRNLKREIRRLRGFRPTIVLKNGQRYRLPDQEEWSAELYTHMMACARCDASRVPRPEPPHYWHVMCNAVDKLEAVKIFHPTYRESEEIEHRGAPFCLDCLVREGKLIDSAIAPGDEGFDTRPIPFGSSEPVPWDKHHASYKEVAV
jgi:hypothetical protein